MERVNFNLGMRQIYFFRPTDVRSTKHFEGQSTLTFGVKCRFFQALDSAENLNKNGNVPPVAPARATAAEKPIHCSFLNVTVETFIVFVLHCIKKSSMSIYYYLSPP